MDKAVKPLKIFISYGHEIDVKDDNGNPLYPEPNNESVVRKIKAYLESRGHEIWLDREKIQKGDDWRRSIYEGVEWSDVAMICLSRKAMKPNGVCRDEISIALGVRGGNMFPVKLEALKDSEYPAYLLTRQLFMEFMDWRSHWTENRIDEAWLDRNLEELAQSLEEKEVGLYGEEMVELKSLLKPWNMNDRLRRLDRGIQTLYNEETHEFENKIVHKFCGRESLFQLFEGRICHAVRSDSERVLWLKKGPGFGKSRFAAELLYRYYYSISAAYFIEYNQRETLDPHTFVKSVAYQLAQANSAYRKKLLKHLKENQNEINLQTGDPQTLFKTLIVDLMSDEIDGGRATQWILVDALDEATENTRNEIASLISRNLDRLPSWICFFITSRDKDGSVNRNFAQFTPIDFTDEENVSDVRDYIIGEFEGMNIAVSEALVNALQEKSEGTFLYPEMVFHDLKKNSFTIDDIRDLPSGVIAYIHSQFDRLFSSDIKSYKREIRPMLGFILTSCEPIPRAVLKYCLEIRRDSELDDQLELLGTFFIQSGSADEDTVVPFHKSVIDYCFNKECSEDYYVYPDEANEDFANRGLKLYKSGALQWTTRTDEKPNIVQRYFLNWLPSHLMNANKTKDAAAVLSDFAFLMKRLRYSNVERVILDYFLFRGKLNRISSDCDAYFDVICSSAHFLRRNSEDNPAYKTMLQIATEVADECPVTQAAERWLNPEAGDSPCDWFWLNKVKRPKEYHSNPCKLVIENTGEFVKLLSNGDALSWSGNDFNLRIWDLETGVCKAVLEGHTDKIWRAIELRSGAILSWSNDKTMRLWSLDGTCKAVFENMYCVEEAIELRSGNILSWDWKTALRIWTPDGACKAVLEGHADQVNKAIELRSGNILSWSKDHTLRLWSPDGACIAVMEGHADDVINAAELSTGDILSWSDDRTLRLWLPDGTCKAVLDGHANIINYAIELRSGDILSWSMDKTLRLWSLDGACKAVMEHDYLKGARMLSSGDILSWDYLGIMRLWSSDGACKAVMKGHDDEIRCAKELRSGNILSWCGGSTPYGERSDDYTMRLWTPDGVCTAVLDGHSGDIFNAIELSSGNILSMSRDGTMRLWSPDGICQAVLEGYTLGGVWEAIELRSGDILSTFTGGTIRIWSPDVSYESVSEGHTNSINGILELRSGDILSWSRDHTLRLWSQDGVCKAVMKGHKDYVEGAEELSSGEIRSWAYRNDRTRRHWSPDGTCLAVLEAFSTIELSSGKFLLECQDHALRLCSPDGTCLGVLEGHTDDVTGARELRSGDILSWSNDHTLRVWSLDGKCKAVLEGHTDRVRGATELHSGDILSWSDDDTLRLWSPDGTCKAVLEGTSAKVLRSGDILSWSSDKTLRLCSPDGTCKAVLEGHFVEELSSGDFLLEFDYDFLRLCSPDGTCKAVLEGRFVEELSSGNFLLKGKDDVFRLWSPEGICKAVLEGYSFMELSSGNILSMCKDDALRLWTPDGACKEVIKDDDPKFDSYYSLFFPKRVYEHFYSKLLDWGIEFQHDFKPIARWNSVECNSRYIGAGRLCVWHGRFVEFLQLNYGNHKSITFEQAHQLLAGEIDESKLVAHSPEPKESAIPKKE